MSFKRLLRIIATRWWVLVALGTITAFAAVSVARSSNESIQPRFTADASITIFQLDGEKAAEYEQRVQTAGDTARTVLAEELDAVPGLGVDANTTAGKLLFRASARTAEEASTRAAGLRDAYLSSAPILTRSEEITATLDALETQILTLRETIAGFNSAPLDPDTQALRTALEAQLAELRQEAASLSLQIKYPELIPPPNTGGGRGDTGTDEEPPTVEELQAQLDEAEASIAAIELDLANLTEANSSEPTPSEELELLALQGQLQSLEDRYTELAIEFLSVDGTNDTAIDPLAPAIDRTPQPRPINAVAGIGALGGALVALMALFVIDRIRRPLYSLTGARSVAPLTVITRKRRSVNPSKPWYPQGDSTRRREIQVARAGLDLSMDDFSAVLVSGLSARPRDVRLLAADLAGAYAASGRRVLLVDASNERDRALPEYDIRHPTLASLLKPSEGTRPGELREKIKLALTDRRLISPGLVAITVGASESVTVDLFAGTDYRVFLEEIATEFDLMVLAGPEITEPAATTIAQRSDAVVLVASEKHTTELDVDKAAGLLNNIDGNAYITLAKGWGGLRSDRLGKVRNRVTSVFRRFGKLVYAATDPFLGPLKGPRILIYHQVGTRLGREMEVSRNAFAKQVDWLSKRGEIVDLETALDRWSEPDSSHLTVLTFDDGYQDIYDHAFPILRDRGIPFTIYLTTDPIESGEPLDPRYPEARPLTWDQITEMIESGLVTIGAHTHTHPDLRSIGRVAIQREIELSDELIESALGFPPRHFAYPWGYWSAAAHTVVRQQYGTATVGAGGAIDGDSDMHFLHRLPVQRTDGVWLFKRRVAGGFILEERLRRRLRGYEGP